MSEHASASQTTASTSPPPTAVWLYPGRNNLGEAVQAVISMEADYIRVHTLAPVGKRTAERVEKLAQQPGLAVRLEMESNVLILDVPRSSVAAKCPSFGSLLHLSVANSTWRFAFYPPQVISGITAPWVFAAMRKGAKAGRPWRQSLNA